MSTSLPGTLTAAITGVDWNDLAAVFAASDKLLNTLDDDRRLLTALTAQALDNPHLRELCEHYDILDKIVLHDDPAGWRLRLHVFLPGYFDRPHNHRWTYVTRLLAGSYTHTLYGTDDQLGDSDDVDVAGLHPRSVRRETIGDTYVLHHTMIHAVTAAPHTTSLVVRGPAVKDRFLVTDRATGKAWWQYGAATEDPAAAAAKRMTRDQAADRVEQLTDAGVLR
ncbi:hypothetical protein [Actinoplanes sp. NPDC026619]|uniref:hypothetical protein n=1 Tax=Actinoplanes sp. NPDC026619 TaxID=3155798 RepID=UPI0033F9447D